jgi:hypothetical protein
MTPLQSALLAACGRVDRWMLDHSIRRRTPDRCAGHLLWSPRRTPANTSPMSEAPFVVQKVEWYQFRDPSGHPFFVMVSSLPNGFFTAVPCRVSVQLADHALMALAATPDEALAQLQGTLAGKGEDEMFPPAG